MLDPARDTISRRLSSGIGRAISGPIYSTFYSIQTVHEMMGGCHFATSLIQCGRRWRLGCRVTAIAVVVHWKACWRRLKCQYIHGDEDTIIFHLSSLLVVTSVISRTQVKHCETRGPFISARHDFPAEASSLARLEPYRKRKYTYQSMFPYLDLMHIVPIQAKPPHLLWYDVLHRYISPRPRDRDKGLLPVTFVFGKPAWNKMKTGLFYRLYMPYTCPR